MTGSQPNPDAPSSSTPPAGANQRVHPDALSPNRTFKYKKFKIVLSTALASAYPLLADRQMNAIDKRAVYKVDRPIRLDILRCTSESPKRACAHVNIPGIAEPELRYPRSCRIALFLNKRDLVVAGIFVLDLLTVCGLDTNDRRPIDISHADYVAFSKK